MHQKDLVKLKLYLNKIDIFETSSNFPKCVNATINPIKKDRERHGTSFMRYLYVNNNLNFIFGENEDIVAAPTIIHILPNYYRLLKLGLDAYLYKDEIRKDILGVHVHNYYIDKNLFLYNFYPDINELEHSMKIELIDKDKFYSSIREKTIKSADYRAYLRINNVIDESRELVRIFWRTYNAYNK